MSTGGVPLPLAVTTTTMTLGVSQPIGVAGLSTSIAASASSIPPPIRMIELPIPPIKTSKSAVSGISFDINDPQEPPGPDGLAKKGEKAKKGGLQVRAAVGSIFERWKKAG